MKNKIFLNTFLRYIFIALGLSVLVLFFSFKTIKTYYINTLTNNLKDICKAISPQASYYLETNDFASLDAFIKKLNLENHKRITIININGTVIADSQKDPKTMANHKTRPEIVNAMSANYGTSIRYSYTVLKNMLYVAVPLNNNTKYIVRASMFIENINEMLNKIIKHIAYSTIIIVMLFFIIAYILTNRNISIPLKKLKEASIKIASGDFNVKVHLKNKDELSDLADSFNLMTDKINTLFKKLSDKKDELNTVINSINEGIFVINSNDKIKIGNESFKKIVQNNKIEGRYYWEFLRMNEFKELVEKSQNNQSTNINEIIILNKIYSISIIPLISSNELVIVLHDITQIKNLEIKKKEFVANVSHELRTPLTAIKGFVETIEEENSHANKHYLNIIKKHTERLINIVEDLLQLSELENKGFKLEISKIDIENLVNCTIKLFEEKAKEKNLPIKLNIEQKLEKFNADPFCLEQIFVNLIDNALKYTDKGEINISIKQDSNHTIITIEDTGIGIKKEHIPYLFERFYVADKSRSRRLGGTGLGLSIVKHIVLLHNGTINIESEVSKGTKIIIDLPLSSS